MPRLIRNSLARLSGFVFRRQPEIKIAPSLRIKKYVAIPALIVSFALGVGSTALIANAGAAGFETVSFVQNTSPSDQVYALQTSDVPAALTLFGNLPTQFAYSGHSFSHWNTAANDSGTSYLDGASYDFSKPVALYAQWTAIDRTVTFIENSNPSDSVYALQTNNALTSLTLFANLVPTFSNTGYKFTGWNTSADGTGTSFSNGSSYGFSSALGLYAQWTPIPTATTTFGTNGGTGTVSSLSNLVGSSVTLPSGSGVSRTGYTFTGWNTQADGSGTTYLSGSSLVLNADTSLYAMWTPDTYNISFDSQSGSASPTTANFTVGGTPLSLPTATYTGYTLKGWFSSATGGVLIGAAGSGYSPSASTTLYAQWSATIQTVTFSPSGGTTTQPSATYSTGMSALQLPAATNVGYAFNGWFSASSGGVLVGVAGASYVPTSSVTLYAQWSALAKYTLTFDANGGNGSIPSMAGFAGSTLLLPGSSGLSRVGFTLASWSTTRSGTGVSYLPNASFTVLGSVSFYARWTGRAPAVLYGAIGNFATNSAVLTNAMKVQVNRLALSIRSHKYQNVSLFGYTTPTGLVSLNASLSHGRAATVASYLRSRLAQLHVKNVVIAVSGQGSLPGGMSPAYSRVEVFVR